MCKELKKSITDSIDEILEKYGVSKEINLFGNPVDDFDFENLTHSEVSNIRKLLIKKMNLKLEI